MKKSIYKHGKEIAAHIEDQLSKGVSKNAILDEMHEEYNDKSTLAKIVGAYTTTEQKEKYKTLNFLLVGMLVLAAATKVAVGLSLPLIALPFLIFSALFPLFFASLVSRYTGWAYRPLWLLSLASCMQILRDSAGNLSMVLVELVLALLITGLAFYLGRKLFPNYGLFGPKKGKDGEYML